MTQSRQTPARAIPKQSASNTSSTKQRSIVSFFGQSSPAPASSPLARSAKTNFEPPRSCLQESTKVNALPKRKLSRKDTASSNGGIAPIFDDGLENSSSEPSNRLATSSLPDSRAETLNPSIDLALSPSLRSAGTPTRKAKVSVNYAESSEDEPWTFDTARQTRNRHKNRAQPPSDVEGNFSGSSSADEDDMAAFIASEDSDDGDRHSRKRRKTLKPPVRSRKIKTDSPPPLSPLPENCDPSVEKSPSSSATALWIYQPLDTEKQPVTKPTPRVSNGPGRKQKAHTREPEERYDWLAHVRDKEKRTPDDPEYDPRTIYIPQQAWTKFSPFEKQYWEIKQNHWDSIVFFKKGKFYELYENDATIGHQEFDFKLTDRVNMRMVGVPESSLDHWVNQFITKQYKVARVDQMETNLGKEMRERQDKSGKKGDKVISRQLACVLTAGTLVDGSMLQDDMAAYCVAIKEFVSPDSPAFGIAIVDTATGRFSLSGFVDDPDLTKFETLVAQVRPRELVLEKSCLSTKALRVLKINTSPTTIWTHLKPAVEFWDADLTRRELNAGKYFVTQGIGDERWPDVLKQMEGDDLVMSALGGLVSYLRSLKLERPLLSQGNFVQYCPIQEMGTLILDGKTLINLEVFANTADGSSEGTLFSLLNNCVTPFGKRLFRQWVAHPLCDTRRINERLDAVEMLNADAIVREQFAARLTKIPDLERLVSRIHAEACRPEDFLRVLDGFEQLDSSIKFLRAFEGGNSLIDRLISDMPDLEEPLSYWKTAFDRRCVLTEKLLIPEPGIDEEFDLSLERLAQVKAKLDVLLQSKRKELNCKSLKFTDIGKEIYQMETPRAVKVPASWQQMSSTRDTKRWYFPQLMELVRALQEAQETHSQLVKEVAVHFFRKFDVDHEIWLRAIQIAAQLDCLVSLAKASKSVGEPACRPQFIENERSQVEFEEFRHPCMMNSVDDFIPNDIKLGGDQAKINLLTGANAAGKSTVLRMSCIAVMMAQIGCFVPARSARLTAIDRIMSRLGANDNIFAAQSTFFIELTETKKILTEASPRSLVILDELGRGTSSYDGVAVAQAVLHHVATHIGCVGFFATHYHSLAAEFEDHPEIRPKRMQILVDDQARKITFLYKLEDGVAEGSFGMHCAAMCGIADRLIVKAESAAKDWEHTSRLKESLSRARKGCYIPLGFLSDISSILSNRALIDGRGTDALLRAVEALQPCESAARAIPAK